MAETKPASGGMDAETQAFLESISQRINSGGATTANFIGLPQGDAAQIGTIETVRGEGEKAPRYHVGYAYLPQIQNWDPIKKKQLQTRLVNSGLLSGDFRYGAWDEASAKAFGDLLGMANQSGNDWEQELYNYYNQQAMEVDPNTGQLKPKRPGGGTLRERQPLKVTYTDPNDLSRVANEVAEKRLGRRFTPDELNKFVATYQGREGEAQKQDWETGYSGGAVTKPPSVETAADMFAESTDPVGSTSRNALPLIDAVNQMLSGFNFGQENPMRG